MKNFRKNIIFNSHQPTLTRVQTFNFPIFQSFNFSIFQFFNLLILSFLILNSSFIIAQNSLDNLTYNYKANTNQLKYITDVGGSVIPGVDLDNQTNNNNYTYNANGQLIKDEAEGILDIDWTVSGKVKQVDIDDNGDFVADRTLQFVYDEMDNRIKKTETNLTTNSPILTTYYMRNATGELISVYEDDGSGVERKELKIAVGTDNAASESITNGVYSRNVGFKNYELKDHLGNVRVVVNDVKEPNLGGVTFTSNIIHATDYYSYGMQMPGRSMISAESYRYGFQGKEKDDELKGNGNSYDFGARLLDPRVGRWLSLDPLAHEFPDKSPYNAMGNNPINRIDPDGKRDLGTHWTNNMQVFAADLNAAVEEGRMTREEADVMYYETVKGAALGMWTGILGATGAGAVLRYGGAAAKLVTAPLVELASTSVGAARAGYVAYQTGASIGGAATVAMANFASNPNAVNTALTLVGSDPIPWTPRAGINVTPIADINYRWGGLNCGLKALAVDRYLATGIASRVPLSGSMKVSTFFNKAGGMHPMNFSSLDNFNLQAGERAVIFGARIDPLTQEPKMGHFWNAVGGNDGKTYFLDADVGFVSNRYMQLGGYSSYKAAITGQIGDGK